MRKHYFNSILLLLFPFVVNAQDCTSGNCQTGFGTMIYENGDKYIGEFRNAQRTGHGVLFMRDGLKYAGTWKDDVKSGEGRLYHNERLQRAGIWSSDRLVQVAKEQNGCLSGDCKNGYGIYLTADGRKIMGAFENGLIKDFAICYYPNGDKYVGYWRFQTRNGTGALFTDKEEQNGTWIDDAFVGGSRNGTALGCIEGDCKNGFGKIIYSDYTYYEGQFKEERAEGFGVCYFADGDIYAGDWHKHKFDGKGTMHYNNGQILSGMWREGRYITVTDNRFDRMMDFAEGTAEGEVSRTWALLVGVARYDNMRSLKYTDDDAYRLNAFLRSPEGGAVPDEQLRVLIDEDATKEKIEKELKYIAGKASKNDMIIFYFSGHGLPGSFLPNDYDGAGVVVKHEDLKAILESSAAKAKLVIADACHSGSFDDAALGSNTKGESETIVDTYYNAFKKSSGGFVMFLSSKADETSIESNGLRQGIFTHYLIKGLKGAANDTVNSDDIVTVDELFRYVYSNVRFYTHQYQTPVLLGNYDKNMPLGVIRK
jgi:hypothetical protein